MSHIETAEIDGGSLRDCTEPPMRGANRFAVSVSAWSRSNRKSSPDATFIPSITVGEMQL